MKETTFVMRCCYSQPLAVMVWIGLLLLTSQDDARSNSQDTNLNDLKKIALLIERLDTDDPDDRDSVTATLRKMGSLAAPSLQKALVDNRDRVRRGAAYALADMRPVRLDLLGQLLKVVREDKSEEVRATTLIALLKWDPTPEKLVTTVLEIAIQDDADHLKIIAIDVLTSIAGDSSQVVSVLRSSLKNGSEKVRFKAACALEKLGPEAKTVAGELLNCLKDDSKSISNQAALILVLLNQHAGQAFPILLEGLKSPDWLERSAALSRLAELGPKAAKAVPLVLPHLQDEMVNEEAIKVLRCIGPAAKDAIPALIDIIENPYDPLKVTYDALQALQKIAPHDQKVTDAVLRRMIVYVLDGERPDTYRSSMLRMIGRFGVKAKSAKPAIQKALKDTSPLVQIAAASAYVNIGENPKDILPILLGYVQKPDIRGSTYISQTQDSAAEALGELGTSARESVPILLHWLRQEKGEHPDPIVVALALAKIDPEHSADKASEALAQMAKGNNSRLALESIEALQQLGTRAVPTLEEMLKDERRGRQKAAVSALGQIGPMAKAAIPALGNLSQDSKPEVRRTVVRACGQINPALSRTILLKALKDTAWSVRYEAVLALGKDDLSATEVRSGLETVLRDVDREISETAKQILASTKK